ncbi:L-ribulokinase [Alkalispirochaeta americana]|uniref:L-ribulokinase n=1 Tax=Alkalispirochaeta americana TaxID=159291 RepID=A0A1N6ULE9_9SPIO|nr:ribulokinase [Alkalispirochaeta americana]SIQ66434.1 L-ribulokinase [Alkalispirochaeta americana]
MKYTVGLDYGTNSVRAVLVQLSDGAELATKVWGYAHGDQGIILDKSDPNVARQHPQDYLEGAEHTLKGVVCSAVEKHGIDPVDIIGIGVDTTGSTPMPVQRDLSPLTDLPGHGDDPTVMAWLWKDHTSMEEAQEITEKSRSNRPRFLEKTGGIYSSEWFWAKIWRAYRDNSGSLAKAYTWMEIADWIPAQLAGITDPDAVKRSICAAGHKGLFHKDWGGYPDQEFLALLHPALVEIRKTLPGKAWTADALAGKLSKEWARKTGIPEGTPIAVGAFDAHLGAVGSGIKEGSLVKIVGTSTCDIMIARDDGHVPDIPGICGIVPGSVIPGYAGIEAGQSAVGDIFNWFVERISPGGPERGTHESLTEDAERLFPGESGLLALDWHNGNRTVLVDQGLTGSIVGLTLQSSPAEIYRSLVEATAYGARRIVEQIEQYGQKIEEVVNCGGISVKNTLVMQVYADVLNRPMKVSRSVQTPALGSAIAASVAAGSSRGGYDDFFTAMEEMTGTMERVFEPIRENAEVYEHLYRLYCDIHDAFGTKQGKKDLFHVMKELLDIRRASKGRVAEKR